ncbi:MAG: hypothetical protein LBQ42_13995 [Synergistaceae bacterium]|nr:hypothetical protein [Synergistaceae bacterium]
MEKNHVWVLFLLIAGILLTGGAAHTARAPRIEWQKSLGGSGSDMAYSIQQTADGGYIVAGSSSSTDGDVAGNRGKDYWIVKLGPDGNGAGLSSNKIARRTPLRSFGLSL